MWREQIENSREREIISDWELQHVRWLEVICIIGMNSSGIHVRYREQGRGLIIKAVFRLQPPPALVSPWSHVGPILSLWGCGQIRIRIRRQRRIWKCNSLTPLLCPWSDSENLTPPPSHRGFPQGSPSVPCFLFFRETLSGGNGNLSSPDTDCLFRSWWPWCDLAHHEAPPDPWCPPGGAGVGLGMGEKSFENF